MAKAKKLKNTPVARSRAFSRSRVSRQLACASASKNELKNIHDVVTLTHPSDPFYVLEVSEFKPNNQLDAEELNTLIRAILRLESRLLRMEETLDEMFRSVSIEVK